MKSSTLRDKLTDIQKLFYVSKHISHQEFWKTVLNNVDCNHKITPENRS
jgi:hypothetical protein